MSELNHGQRVVVRLPAGHRAGRDWPEMDVKGTVQLPWRPAAGGQAPKVAVRLETQHEGQYSEFPRDWVRLV